jgi:hypothetical protein
MQLFASVVCKEGLSDEECERKAKPIKDSLVEVVGSIQFQDQTVDQKKGPNESIREAK